LRQYISPDLTLEDGTAILSQNRQHISPDLTLEDREDILSQNTGNNLRTKALEQPRTNYTAEEA